MDLLIDHFPVFVSNQVLTSGHLNDVFGYLDQQTRQTRSHLIGIGIACGLEFKLDGLEIKLARGCGVTSEGYLIIEPDEVTLSSYRPYVVPDDVDYPAFKNAAHQPYQLWELLPAGATGAVKALNDPAGFLDDKAVLLFLELKKDGLRNCSPNGCDDKGSEVTATVRRLLVARADLDEIIAAGNGLGGGLTAGDIETALSSRLNLPDIRLRRFDVLNTDPTTSGDIYAAFLSVFRPAGLASKMAVALSAAYAAFEPLLRATYQTDPFGSFGTAFGFLDDAPQSPEQVHFLQYYVDLFDDLVRAYDEFRWSGAELICACCPPEGLFPRHLALGLVHPETVAQPSHYRQRFIASPAVGKCAQESGELVQLFSRLVEMAARFGNEPSLPRSDGQAKLDPQIRVTPSTLGDRPLATKAIPYYYAQDGSPPLYRLWDPKRTRRNRANQNLSYRAEEYTPPAPPFVAEPLSYDLEPYNFLRVEGHLGKPYEAVLSTLLSLKSEYRLPVDIIALRTGGYDETQPVDLSRESARFEDLETLYDSLREDLAASLAEGARELYDTDNSESEVGEGTPRLPLLRKYAPTYRYPANSLGAWYERFLPQFLTRPYIDIDQTSVDASSVARIARVLLGGTDGLSNDRTPHAVAIFYFSELAETLAARLDILQFVEFENRYQDLLALIHFFRNDAISASQQRLVSLCEQILFSGRLDSIRSVHEEYLRRIADLRKRQFLSTFLAQHPGIQHKAGVPLGGTFIIVYHGEAKPRGKPRRPFGADVAGDLGGVFVEEPETRRSMRTLAREADAAAAVQPRVLKADIIEAIRRIGGDEVLSLNPDIELLIGTLTGEVAIGGAGVRPEFLDMASKIIAETVAGLDDGVVIADFFLPYRVSCCGPTIQYSLPKPPPAFSIKMGCTDDDGTAAVGVRVKGGVAPYEVSVDRGTYQALPAGNLPLKAGQHSLKLRDAEGVETAAQDVVVPDPVVIGAPAFECSAGNFTAQLAISGGVAPYVVNDQPFDGGRFTTAPVPSGTQVTIEVVDSNGCRRRVEFTHDCPVVLPLSFTKSVACTAPSGFAPVTVTPAGGIGPYRVSIDNAALQPVGGPFSLLAGQHALVVRDSRDVATPAQTVAIPTPILITGLRYTCGGGNYVADFTVSGGTAPYKVGGTPFGGGPFTTGAFPSGSSQTLDVVDREGCEVSVPLQRTCPPECNLPCEGIAVRHGYRFWLPEPDPMAPYKSFKVENLVVSIDAKEGEPGTDLTSKIKSILRGTAAELDAGNFPSLVAKWIGRINDLIKTTPGYSDPKGDWLTLAYDPAIGPNFRGTLWIERFECLSFSIQMRITATRTPQNSRESITETFDLIYSRDGTSVTPVLNEGAGKEVIIPLFGGTRINKCAADPQPKPFCEGVNFTLRTKHDVAGKRLFLDVFTIPLPEPVTFVWEVQDGAPAMSNKDHFETEVLTFGTKMVTVTAYTEDGCFVAAAFAVNVG